MSSPATALNSPSFGSLSPTPGGRTLIQWAALQTRKLRPWTRAWASRLTLGGLPPGTRSGAETCGISAQVAEPSTGTHSSLAAAPTPPPGDSGNEPSSECSATLIESLRDKVRRTSEVDERLNRATDEIGARFGAIGTAIEVMSQSGARLVEEGERLLLLASGRTEGEAVLESALKLLESPLAYLETSAARLGDLADRLGSCQEEITEILKLQPQFETTVGPLTYINLLFKVEAAALPPQVRHMFEAVAQEIGTLEHDVEHMFRAKFSALAEMQASIGVLVRQLQKTLPARRRDALAKRAKIASTLQELRQELQGNTDRDLKLTTTTRGIAEQINQVVIGLQFHDIVSQKLAHLRESLRLSRENAARLPLSAPEENLTALGELQNANQLQTAHLDAIQADLNDAAQQIHDGIQSILQATKQLDAGCVALAELNQITVAPDGMIQVLLDTLEDANRSVASALKDASQAKDRLEPIEAMAQSLTSTVASMSITMHFIALNAQILAIKAGGGTGLEVLAAQSVEVSAETTRFSADVLARLGRLAASLIATSQDCTGMQADGTCQREVLLGQGSAMERNLHELRNRSLQALAAVEREKELIQHQAADVQKLSEPGAAFGARLTGCVSHLKEIYQVLVTLVGGRNISAATSGRDSWWQKYTMESERAVHRAISEGQPLPPPENHVAAATAAASSSVELF